MKPSIYELLMLQGKEEEVLEVINQLITDLEKVVKNLDPGNKEFLEEIEEYMLQVNGKMLNVLLKTYDERLLILIERFKAIISHVSALKNDAITM